MTKVYLLPCECGEKLRIDPTQAGLDVRCSCGRDVKAPTFRDLARLEQVEAGTDSQPLPEWGARHRLLLGGAMILACGLLIAGWFWHKTPPYPTFKINPASAKAEADAIRAMPAEQVIEAWSQVAEKGLDTTEMPQYEDYRRTLSHVRGNMYAGLAVAAVGVLVLALSLFVGRPAASHKPQGTTR